MVKQYEIANGVLCERVEECTMGCLAPGNPAEVHKPGCGLVPVLEVADIEETVQQYSDLISVYQTLRAMLGLDPFQTSRAAQDELLASVELLEQRFQDEHWEPGVITPPLAGTRKRKVHEELLYALLGAMRCIPDGKVSNGCVIADGAQIKRWLHHAGRAAVETLKADVAGAESGMTQLENLVAEGELRWSPQLEGLKTRLEEIASGDAAWDFESEESRRHMARTGRWLLKGQEAARG